MIPKLLWVVSLMILKLLWIVDCINSTWHTPGYLVAVSRLYVCCWQLAWPYAQIYCDWFLRTIAWPSLRTKVAQPSVQQFCWRISVRSVDYCCAAVHMAQCIGTVAEPSSQWLHTNKAACLFTDKRMRCWHLCVVMLMRRLCTTALNLTKPGTWRPASASIRYPSVSLFSTKYNHHMTNVCASSKSHHGLHHG